jgi:hypothetical protein
MAPANTEMTLPVIVTSLRSAPKADGNEQMPNKDSSPNSLPLITTVENV